MIVADLAAAAVPGLPGSPLQKLSCGSGKALMQRQPLLPQAIGQSVSIVGGIVMGTAAVEAGIISPIALIAVSTAGVCGFVLPNRDLAQAVRGWRFCIAALGAVCGLWGVIGGALILFIHLLSIKSLGVSYLSGNTTVREGGGILRLRLSRMKQRNFRLRPIDRRNQK